MSRRSEPADFWARVKIGKPDQCWPWTGSTQQQGYGTIMYQGTKWLTHRLAVKLHRNEEPVAVCHDCDNPPCCNPAHLVSADYEWNARDRARKGRKGDISGIKHYMSRLSAEDLADIRRRLEAGESQYAIAKRYGYSQPGINHIARGRSHKDGRPVPPKIDQKGTRHSQAKFDEAQLAEIRRRLTHGDPAKEIAQDFRVSPHVIWGIASGRTYNDR